MSMVLTTLQVIHSLFRWFHQWCISKKKVICTELFLYIVYWHMYQIHPIWKYSSAVSRHWAVSNPGINDRPHYVCLLWEHLSPICLRNLLNPSQVFHSQSVAMRRLTCKHSSTQTLCQHIFYKMSHENNLSSKMIPQLCIFLGLFQGLFWFILSDLFKNYFVTNHQEQLTFIFHLIHLFFQVSVRFFFNTSTTIALWPCFMATPTPHLIGYNSLYWH